MGLWPRSVLYLPGLRANVACTRTEGAHARLDLQNGTCIPDTINAKPLNTLKTP